LSNFPLTSIEFGEVGQQPTSREENVKFGGKRRRKREKSYGFDSIH